MSSNLQATLTEVEENSSSPTFEELLEQYEYDHPRYGEILKGIVLEVNAEEIIVDIGGKHDAFVTRRDLERLEDDVLDGLEPGSELNVYVLRPRGDSGEVMVSINKALTLEDWERATELMDQNETIEVQVSGFNKGGALVEFGRLRGFVPNSQLAEVTRGATPDQQNESKAELVGRNVNAKVIEVNQRRNRLVLSEVAARRDQRRELLEQLEVGQVITGRVVRLVEYGAFVDIGGVNGLIHISKLDWQHVNHPSEVLSVGEEIEVRIDEVDVERERISLNRQALIADPWDQIAETCKVEDLLTGKISSVVDYGVFVDLPNGVTGLVHVSEMSSFNVTNPRTWAEEGADLLVRIISVDANRKRIGLSLDSVTQEELYDWMTARGDEAPIAMLVAQQAPEDDPEPVAEEVPEPVAEDDFEPVAEEVPEPAAEDALASVAEEEA